MLSGLPGLVALWGRSGVPVSAAVLDEADGEDDGQDGQPQPEQGPHRGGDSREPPQVDVPGGDEAVTERRHTHDRHTDGSRQAGVEAAGERLLQVDAPVGLLGQEGPGHAVQDQSDTGEDREHYPYAAHQNRIQTEAVGDPAGHTGDPALVGAHEARAAQGVEETARRAALGPGPGPAVLLVGGDGPGLRARLRAVLGAASAAGAVGVGRTGGRGVGGRVAVRRGSGHVIHAINSSPPRPAPRSGDPLNDPRLSPEYPDGPSDRGP